MVNIFLWDTVEKENNEMVLLTQKFVESTENKYNTVYFVKEIFSKKVESDSIVIKIEGYDDSIQINDKLEDGLVERFISDYLRFFDSEYKLIVTIYKKIKNHELSIYSIEKYGEYLESLTISDVIGVFEEKFLVYDYVIFRLVNDLGNFCTKRFYFLDYNKNVDVANVSNKVQLDYDIGEKRNNYCNYSGKNTVAFSPFDFHLIDKIETNKITTTFDRITIALSLFYLSNIVNLDKNTIYFKIEGYKSIQSKVDLKANNNIINTSRNLFEIFEWVYENKNNIADKIGITRNVISLYVDDLETLNIDEDILASIHSGYDIYLKENVDRYIEVLNQQTVFLNDLNDQVSNSALEFSKKFKSNFIGFFSFLFTTIIFNIISTGKINNIFTRDITIITVVLLVISLLYLVFSIIESEMDLKKMKKRYDRNKKNYSLILDKKDIARIFNDDDYFKEDKKYLRNNIIIYSILWIATIVILVIAICILGTFTETELYSWQETFHRMNI